MNSLASKFADRPCTSKRAEGVRRPLRKVLHLINGDDYSGGERVQDLLGLRLPDFGYAVHYVCLKRGRFDVAREAQQVPLDTFPMQHKFDLRPAVQAARRAREAGCEIIHTHSTRTLLVGRIAASIARLPIVHHVQSPAIADSFEVWRNRANAIVTRVCLSGLTNIIAVSESLKRYLGRQGLSPQRVEVIPNAVPARPALPHRIRPTNSWRIGICAMFRPRKGLEVLLEALAQLRRQNTPFTLRAVGYFQDANYESHIKHRVAELRLADVVDWRGFSDNVYDELAQMDLFVLPSLCGEGLPLAVLEAMAAGVPVVSTDVEGTPEAIRDGVDGLIVEPGNAQALAAALQRVMRGDVDWQSLRTSAHRRQTDLYSDTKLASDVARIYDRILRRSAAAPSTNGDQSAGPRRMDESRLESADTIGTWSCA